MKTIPTLIDKIAAQFPDAPSVIISSDDNDGPSEPMTYRDLVQESRVVATGLRNLGMGPGDCLVLWLPNQWEWLVLALATMRLGGFVVPLNTRFLRSDAAAVLEATKARFVAVPRSFLRTDYLVELTRAVEDSTSVSLCATVVVGGSDKGGRVVLPQASTVGRLEPYGRLRHGDALSSDAVVGPDSAAHVYVSSGTTGAPKLPLHTHRSLMSRCTAAGRHFGFSPGSVVLAAVPFAGAWGLGLAFAALARGACLVPMSVFEPGRAIDTIERCSVTHVHGSDDMLQAILRHPKYEASRCQSWRSALYGNFTGLAGMELVTECEAAGLRVTTAYGASEMHAFLAVWRESDSRHSRSRAGGWLLEDDVEIRSVEPGLLPVKTLPPGSAGELQVRGPSIMSNYLGSPELTSEVFTSDGWYRTGDIGETLKGRGVVFHCRAKDTLRLRGFLVDPREVEKELMAHPSVELAQVVGLQTSGGQIAVAFVQIHSNRADPDPDELVAFCRGRVASYKVPTHVHVVDRFPEIEGPNGTKIHKRRLQELAQELLE